MSETYFAVVFECRSYLKWFYSIYTLPHKTETASCFKKNAKKKHQNHMCLEVKLAEIKDCEDHHKLFLKPKIRLCPS